MTDKLFNDLVSQLGLGELLSPYVFSMTEKELLPFLYHYKFDFSKSELDKLLAFCSTPLDMNVFAGALYMCIGSDSFLKNQAEIFRALLDYKANDFAF